MATLDGSPVHRAARPAPRGSRRSRRGRSRMSWRWDAAATRRGGRTPTRSAGCGIRRPRASRGKLACGPPRDTRVCGPSTTSERSHVWLGGHGHAYAHDGCCVRPSTGIDGPATDAFADVPSMIPRILRQMLSVPRGRGLLRRTSKSALRTETASHRRSGLAWLRSTTNDDGPRRHPIDRSRAMPTARLRIAAGVASYAVTGCRSGHRCAIVLGLDRRTSSSA